MPVVDYEKYGEMLDKAFENNYAYPAVNISTIDNANAAIEGFVEANSDGIIEMSAGAGKHASGNLNDSVLGCITLADHIRKIADQYDVNIAIHTDHCPPKLVDSWLKPLIEETARRRKKGRPNLFNSHMFDGAELPLKENMDKAVEILEMCAENDILLEVEAGVVGGEEDGMDNRGVENEKLYTTPGDMVYVHERLSEVEGAKYMFAATFGNVHGVYKPGSVKLKPTILKQGQDAVAEKYGEDEKFWLVFHGGSGSGLDEIRETLDYGVIKMNIDTDTQYAFTRPVVDHFFKNYDLALKIDGEVGSKKGYDPRKYLAKGRKGMTERVVQACKDLRCAGKSMGK
ncbi:MAG: class II fructose-bisphosphate aldolase [Candidatus Marinimicrobia bacterium]|nr:class II fructose-bisphosphate aldolase [Candidatus Neomarinimicrobiota bacterium]